MRFRPEPPFSHGQTPRSAVLLCNLGTPDEATAPALRRYLAQFLSDPRVVEIPALLWKLILHGIILRVRPAKSAAKYASIWMPEGSPLRVWTERQAKLLGGYLGERGHVLTVRPAMRYGNPGIPQALDELAAAGVTRVLVIPAYPQYSGATTASTIDAVTQWTARRRNLPELRFVNRYHDEPGYIAALAASVRDHWAREGRPDKLVMSFHGMPARTLRWATPTTANA
jgi:ferrochelatase